MTPLYTEGLQAELRRELRKSALCLLLLLLLGLGLGLAVFFGGELSLGRAVFGWVTTAAAGIGVMSVFQRRFLPLYRSDRLMARLSPREGTPVSGVFRGLREAKALKQGVLMQTLRLDAGDRVKNEAFEREIQVPAVFFDLSFREGQLLEGNLAENVLISTKEPVTARCRAEGAAYRVSPLACAAVVLLAATLWGSFYAGGRLSAQGERLRVAVCSIAHHQETDDRIISAVADGGGPALEIGYSNTLNGEQVASFLATYGSFEADILFLSGTHFESVFYCDGYPLDTAALERALGFAPRYMKDEYGRETAVILYEPGDESYNGNFPGLYDWFAVDSSVPLVAALRYGTPYGENGKAQQVLEDILCTLLE